MVANIWAAVKYRADECRGGLGGSNIWSQIHRFQVRSRGLAVLGVFYSNFNLMSFLRFPF